MKRILALDFDGVISDSAPECFWIALRTYLEMRPDSRLANTSSGAAIQDPLPRRETVEGNELYREILQLMPLGNRAEDFGVILSILDSSEKTEDQAAYDAARAAAGAAFHVEFHERFYRIRREVSDREPVAWERLMGPYRDFVALLQGRPASVELAVATAKDRRSVVRLLERYGLSQHLRDDLLLDKEVGVSKLSHLELLARRTGADLSSITFLDDKVNHLDSVSPLGVRCCLATWGYNGDREHKLAREKGYLLCDLDNARTQLFTDG
jgi:phosphoglycolate phosphatase-like HAD superfamily hydrolase